AHGLAPVQAPASAGPQLAPPNATYIMAFVAGFDDGLLGGTSEVEILGRYWDPINGGPLYTARFEGVMKDSLVSETRLLIPGKSPGSAGDLVDIDVRETDWLGWDDIGSRSFYDADNGQFRPICKVYNSSPPPYCFTGGPML